MVLITTTVFWDLSILVLGLIGILYWLATKNFNYWRKKGVPYLEPMPFVGSLWELVISKTCLGELFKKIYLQHKGKPYIGMFAFHRPILLVRDPEIIKSILVKDFSSFPDHTFCPIDPMFVKNVFGVNAPRWRALRMNLVPTFTTGKMKIMYDVVNDCGKEMCNYVEREMKNADSAVLEVREILARYATDITTLAGFGLQGNALKDPDAEFRRILRKIVEWDYWKGLKATAAFFAPQLITSLRLYIWEKEIVQFTRRVVWQTVEHRERTGLVRKDYLDLLMQLKAKGYADCDAPHTLTDGDAKANGAEVNYALEDDDFVAQAFVFMFAGFETSSTTEMFALYELACHPDVQTRLRQEVRDVVRAHGGLTYDAIKAMPFMEQVVQETLRLYPILPFLDRMCKEEYRIPDTDVVLEKGTTVMVPIMGIQRDPDLFEDPDSFKPERFDNGLRSIPPFAHMPFGMGPRICIGIRMGVMLVKVGLAYFLDRFEVQPSKHTKVPVKMNPHSFLLAAKGGTHLTVTRAQGSIL